MSKSIKKRYLKALNRHLKKESGGKFETDFVFYPLGAKPKRLFQKDGSARLKMFQQTREQPSLRNAS